MKHTQRKQAERLFCAFGDLAPHTLEASRTPTRGKESHIRIRRLIIASVAAVLSLCLVTLTVFAAVPSLRRMLNLPFLRESERQDSVPEGWVGIYTVEDLDRIRHDRHGKYILMNDLTFAEDAPPFTPIGSYEEPFMGQFDGNGYVIRGLKLEATQDTPAVEETNYVVDGVYRPVTYHKAESIPALYVGLFAYSGFRDLYPYFYGDRPYEGMIINLGVENATVTVENAGNAYVGILAGHASYVAGCYVKDSTLTVNGYTREAEFGELSLRVGGLAGEAQLMDSCYTLNNRVTLAGTRELYVTDCSCFTGALAGSLYTVITSYSADCKVTADHPDTARGDLYGHVSLLPRVMNHTQFWMVYERYYRATHGLTPEEPLPENWKTAYEPGSDADFYCRRFYSYYVAKPLSILSGDMGMDFSNLNPALLMGEFSPEINMYLLDVALTPEEAIRMERELAEKVGIETLCEIMTYDNFKIGPLDCYVLNTDKAYKRSDFSEFDFDSIWKMKDGRPILRIFEN